MYQSNGVYQTTCLIRPLAVLVMQWLGIGLMVERLLF